jgi:hypothetical protein
VHAAGARRERELARAYILAVGAFDASATAFATFCTAGNSPKRLNAVRHGSATLTFPGPRLIEFVHASCRALWPFQGRSSCRPA